MAESTGLRERKRRRTHDALSEAAIALFLERGYDRVSVAEIAAAAEVSKPTLFKYFPSKEDLVLHRFADHQGEAARVVRSRPAGTAPLTALHRHFLAGLARRDPVTGLNDDRRVLAYHELVFATPTLAARLARYVTGDEEDLAEALAETATEGHDLTPRLAAAQILAAQRVLARENWRLLTQGAPATTLYPDAVAAADHAFALLRTGHASYSE